MWIHCYENNTSLHFKKKEKKLQTYKPNSVTSISLKSKTEASIIYLVSSSPTNPICLPLPAVPNNRNNRASNSTFPKENWNVRGISTHKVYPPSQLLGNVVRSYRTFSPLPRLLRAVIFCDTLCIFLLPK